MDLGDWLAREKLTDAAFAARVGCNQTTINRARRGLTMPEPLLAARIVAATDRQVQASDLLNKFVDSRNTPAAPQHASAA